MVVHVLVNVAQETRSNDAHGSKCDADQIHVSVALGKCLPSRCHHDRVRGGVARDAWDRLQFVGHGCGGEQDGFLDVCCVGNSEIEDHGAANVFNYVGYEFFDQNTVVGHVADAAAENANSERERGYGSNEVLR